MKNATVGVIGGGNIAQKHLHVLSDIPQVGRIILVEPNPETREETGKRFEIEDRLDSIDALLDEQVDAVFVLVSVLAVYEVAGRMLRAGIPTFLEKPPGIYTWQTRELADVARENSTLAMVGVNRRFYSTCMKARVLALEIGPIETIQLEAHEDFERVRTVDKFPVEVWKRWSVANGIHALDMLRFFGGEVSNVTSIQKIVEGPMPDACSALLEYENGAHGRASMDWFGPGGHRFEIRSKGMTLTSSSGYTTVTVRRRGKATELIEFDDVDRGHKPGFFRQDSTFLNCVQTGEPLPFPACDLDDAVRTMEMTDRIVGA